MGDNKISNILIPQLRKTPRSKNASEIHKRPGSADEFAKLLNGELNEAKSKDDGLEVSGHAIKRLKERNLVMDTNEFTKIKSAVDKLKQKGGKDSLVITDNAAYIIDVENRKIVTAMDKENMAENVFTNIDSTMIV